MKKQLLLGMVSTVFMSMALAGGPGGKLSSEKFNRDLEKRDSEIKAGAALHGVDIRNEKESIRDALITKFVRTKDSDKRMDIPVDVTELKAAIDMTHDIDVNGTITKISGLELARRIFGIRESLELVRQKVASKEITIDEATAAKLQAQEEILPILVKQFSALGVRAAGARPGGKTAEATARDTRLYLKAFNEGLNTAITGNGREINAYAEVGSKEIEIKDSKPKLMVDELFDQAMKAKYADKSEAKKKELEGCKR